MKSVWDFLIVLGMLISLSRISTTQNTGNCQFDDDDVIGDSGNYVNTVIDDTAISQTIKTWTFKGNLKPTCIANCDFFDAKVDQNNLIISTTSNFANLDLNTPPQSNSIVNIAPSFKFICDGDSIMVFVQPVKDTNGYPPTFEQDTYEYTVPLPLMPNYQITSFKDRIIVTDIDFSNTDVTFKIDGSDKFEINRISGDAKQYEAQLTVKEPTWFEGDITITATDTGTPSKSSTATIKIIADSDSSLPEVPTFSEAYYVYDYTEEDGNPQLNLKGNPILVTSQTEPKVTLSSGSLPDTFTVDYDRLTNIVTIGVNKKIENPSSHTLVLTLTATIEIGTKSESTNVGVLINMPDELVTIVPKFSSNFYSATYIPTTDLDTITVSEDIIVTPSENIQVEIKEPENQKYFKFNCLDNKCTLAIVADLPQTILDNNIELILSLQASIPGQTNAPTASATVIVDLPQKYKPVLTQSAYIGSYIQDEAALDSINLENGPIAVLTQNAKDFDINIISGPSNFEFAPSSDETNWVLNVVKDLSEGDLQESTITISFEIVSHIDSSKGTGLVIIKLPKKTVTSPFYFSDVLFVGEYKEDTNTIILDNDIMIEGNSLDQLDVEIIGDSSNYFDFSYDKVSGKVTITVKNIPTETLENESAISFNVQATLLPVKVSAGVVVKLPKKTVTSPFYFSDVLYVAEYKEDTNTIALEKDILIKGKSLDQLAVELIGDSAAYFERSYDKMSGKVTITVKEIPIQTLDNESAISFSVQATLLEVKISAGVVVKLPKKTVTSPFYFSNVLYVGEYNEETNTITFDGDVLLQGEALDELTVTLVGESATYFESSFDPESGIVTITVKEIPPQILNDECTISFIVKAYFFDVKISAGLMVKLPKESGNEDALDSTDLTPYIVVISLLAILLIGFLLASAIFYYYRLKRSNNYVDMNEDEAARESRFTRNPKVSDIEQIERPVRRPTGFLKFNLEDKDGPNESVTELDGPVIDRRKSVVFDDTVEELQIQAKNNDEESSENDSSDEDNLEEEKQNSLGNSYI